MAHERWGGCMLPEDWFKKLSRKDTRNRNSWWRYYDTRRAADDEAARAFTKLPAARRAELLGLARVAPEPKKPRRRKSES